MFQRGEILKWFAQIGDSFVCSFLASIETTVYLTWWSLPTWWSIGREIAIQWGSESLGPKNLALHLKFRRSPYRNNDWSDIWGADLTNLRSRCLSEARFWRPCLKFSSPWSVISLPYELSLRIVDVIKFNLLHTFRDPKPNIVSRWASEDLGPNGLVQHLLLLDNYQSHDSCDMRDSLTHNIQDQDVVKRLILENLVANYTYHDLWGCNSNKNERSHGKLKSGSEGFS